MKKYLSKVFFHVQEEKTVSSLNKVANIPQGFFKDVSIGEARESKEYWSIIHRAFTGTSKSSPIIGSIKEPTDDKYLEHAKCITEGNRLKIDFEDPNFVRNIYKALRLKLINAEQLATVSLWYYAVDFFKNEEQEKATYNIYSFEEEGHYKHCLQTKGRI